MNVYVHIKIYSVSSSVLVSLFQHAGFVRTNNKCPRKITLFVISCSYSDAKLVKKRPSNWLSVHFWPLKCLDLTIKCIKQTDSFILPALYIELNLCSTLEQCINFTSQVRTELHTLKTWLHTNKLMSGQAR